MSMDVLKNKIRKLRNPSALTIAPTLDTLPPAYAGVSGMGEYCRKSLEALKGVLPAVKVSFSHFALLGAEGLQELQSVLDAAKKLGFYVILDGPSVHSPWAAERAAALLRPDSPYPCHCLISDPYAGSDVIKPFLPACKDKAGLQDSTVIHFGDKLV